MKKNKLPKVDQVKGVKFITNPDLDKYSKIVVNPDKLELANSILSQIKFPQGFLGDNKE